MRLTPINPQNYHLIRPWRNANRQHFLSQEYITKKIHDQWFQHYQSSNHQHLYIITHQEKPAGTCGVIITPKGTEIDKMLIADPKMRGKGLMQKALKLLLKKHPSNRYYLKVLSNNHKAIRFYQTQGFTVTQTIHKLTTMERLSIDRYLKIDN